MVPGIVFHWIINESPLGDDHGVIPWKFCCVKAGKLPTLPTWKIRLHQGKSATMELDGYLSLGEKAKMSYEPE
jgi:hypothetical protein